MHSIKRCYHNEGEGKRAQPPSEEHRETARPPANWPLFYANDDTENNVALVLVVAAGVIVVRVLVVVVKLVLAIDKLPRTDTVTVPEKQCISVERRL